MAERERAGAGNLRLQARRIGDRTIVELHGELDLASAPLLESELELAARDSAALVLDLDDLEFIDSTGLRLILTAHSRADRDGRRFAVTRGSKQVQRLLEISGIGQHLPIVESPEELLV